MLTTRGYGRLIEPLTGRVLERPEVVERSSARAAEFARYGLKRSDRVFLHNGNTIDFFVDLLATWRLGACAIPIDNRLAHSEIATLAVAARPRLSIWGDSPTEATRAAFQDLDVTVLDADTERPSPSVRAVSALGSFSLDDDALILFTSGTTGNPKGVVHTHRSLRVRWVSLFTSLGLTPFQRTLCLLPTHFGHGLICNCLFPWLFGQDLHILPPFRADLLANLGELIDQHDITFLSSVPTVWRLALKIAKPPRKGTLARVFSGSAPLSGSLWRSIQGWTGVPVTNAYGITETASWLAGTAGDAEPEDGLVGEVWGGALAVLPVQETTPPPDFSAACKSNEPGFVWVNTPALMKGYLDQDALTASVVCGGWFSTGDLGVIDDGGRLHLLGRVREEINKSGQKVYPADIDNVIEQFEQTIDVCTFAVPDPLHGEDIGVAVVLETQSDDVLVRLHEWTCGRLGSHQVPKRWYVVQTIPRTSRGKVNRREVAEFCERLPPVSLSSLRRGPTPK